MHPDDGQLRAYLDHELDENVYASITKHLAACRECHTRVDELSAVAASINMHFAKLAPSRDQASLSAQTALARFKMRPAEKQKEIPMLTKILNPRFRAAWTMIAVAALFAVSMTFPPVRTWAEGVLAQFRIQQVVVLPIDPTRLGELTGNTAIAKQIGQLLSDSMTIVKEPGAPKSATNVAQASQLAGFPVRLPTSRNDTPQLSVQNSAAFQMVVNRNRAQSLLDQAGYSKLQLPASLDKALIKVNVPASVTAAYGNCPNLEKADLESKDSPGRKFVNCIILAQIPSPTVDTPPNVDLRQLAEIGLQFTGMTADQAHAYSETVDWASTLVIPIPRNGATYKPAMVDGASGYLIQRPLDYAPQYAIVWVKNGIVYAISGMGADTTIAINMANSMK